MMALFRDAAVPLCQRSKKTLSFGSRGSTTSLRSHAGRSACKLACLSVCLHVPTPVQEESFEHFRNRTALKRAFQKTCQESGTTEGFVRRRHLADLLRNIHVYSKPG